ncbi:MAG: biopolymer transporter ExbD [Marinobacter sp.]|uniref:ExbD/TolR family protein n=1 Tax=Marinobacter sp. TaxID=50741 RepID=UPI00299DF572|nr:biopolymer transporter ExbD [Marinobacter sp.]MDX1633165.1 biopolymer transporter ExbD [Marinobacter sp.]
MKLSRRARRRQRHYGRMHRAGGLNLVSLMDIFTILVFFLMVNSSDVKVMQNASALPLPESTADSQARDTLVVEVTPNAILVQGREVARLDTGDPDLAGLAQELAYQRNRQRQVPAEGLEVTVMAGRDTQYRLLRQVMQTCVDEDYRRVHLAVEHKPMEVANG